MRRLSAFEIQAASRAFMVQMTRERFLRGGGSPPLPTLEELAPVDRTILQRAIAAAIMAAEPANIERLRQAAEAPDSEPAGEPA